MTGSKPYYIKLPGERAGTVWGSRHEVEQTPFPHARIYDADGDLIATVWIDTIVLYTTTGDSGELVEVK